MGRLAFPDASDECDKTILEITRPTMLKSRPVRSLQKSKTYGKPETNCYSIELIYILNEKLTHDT